EIRHGSRIAPREACRQIETPKRLLTERLRAHHAFDAAQNQLLEFLRSRKFPVARCEITGIVSERGEPCFTAIIILAPGNGMEIAMPRVTSYHRLVLGHEALRNDIGA